MITVIKKIIIKEKEGKKQGEKKRVYDETRSWAPGTTRPRGLSRQNLAKSFDVIFTVNTSKEV